MSAGNLSHLRAGVLRTPIGVQHHLLGQIRMQCYGHCDRSGDPVGMEVVLNGPAEHPTGMPIMQRAHVPPALPGAHMALVHTVQRPGAESAFHRIRDRWRFQTDHGRGRCEGTRTDPLKALAYQRGSHCLE